MSKIHRLVCVHPDQLQQLLACIFTLLHRDNFVDAFRMYPFNLFTCGGQHEIIWQISSVDIIPESSFSFQDSMILEWDFWCWACSPFNSIQLVILFELFTMCLQNRCYQFWWVRVQQRGLHVRIHPIVSHTFFACSSKQLSNALLILQPSVKKAVGLRTKLLDSGRFASFEHSICTQVLVREFVPRGFSPRCMSSLMFMQPVTISKNAVACSIASSHEDPHEVTSISSRVDLNPQSVAPSIVSQRMDLC